MMPGLGAGARRTVAIAVVLVATACSSDGPGASLEDCVPADTTWSAARVWNEQVLQAIRRDFPAPTEHSRNLFHLSAAMWDAWAAYDQVAAGYFVTEKHTADDVDAARAEAISFAAYRVLWDRYVPSARAFETLPMLDQTMADLCYDTAFTATEGDRPAALGNRIAATVLEHGLSDGSLEEAEYVDSTYQPVNEPLEVATAGTVMADPNRWQPLALETFLTQNDLPVPIEAQEFVGPHWGYVSPFALPVAEDGLPIDPGPPPYLSDPATDDDFKQSALEVIRFSSYLDPRDGVREDIGPGSLGNNPLGTNDGSGHPVNPISGAAYPPNTVARGDFGRAVAEFWADGPESETPPGHWNTLANAVSDDPDLEHRMGGTGPVLGRLEWDVKLYLALNGAVHDAAIAAWGSKSYYDYVRPISMIRYMGGLGQSSDPAGLSYHPDGLPLEDGLVEVITAVSSAPGERHAHLAEYVGEVAVWAWAGNPSDPEEELAGVDWIRAVTWVPYQRSTFVTPSFAGYVSGHSTFSRAAAEVMTELTGSEFFPGGMGEWTVPAGALEFEAGPGTDVTLQWATYFDASDQAGLSRLYGGIHVSADDLAGRIMGAESGQGAWELAVRYFDGTADARNTG